MGHILVGKSRFFMLSGLRHFGYGSEGFYSFPFVPKDCLYGPRFFPGLSSHSFQINKGICLRLASSMLQFFLASLPKSKERAVVAFYFKHPVSTFFCPLIMVIKGMLFIVDIG